MHAQPASPRPITGRFVLFALLAFFGTVVAVNVVMARLAVSTFGGVETASSYKAGLAFRSEELAAEKQAGLHWRVEAAIAGLGGDGRIVTVTVRDAEGRPVPGLEAVARLSHPTDARRDVPLTFTDVGSGTFRTSTEAHAGSWDLVIDLSQGGTRLFRSKNRVQLP